jgi:endonuclease/exonuclease/phosphatase family metal-dependent hydrolase
LIAGGRVTYGEYTSDMGTDLVVRTYNTLYARGARRRGWPEYPRRLALAVETLQDAWPDEVGLIGLQEAGDRVTGCGPDEPGERSVTACVAALLRRRFAADVGFAEHHELGTIWDEAVWEAIPGGGAWRIGRKRVLVSRQGVDFGAVRYLLGVKLRQRATGRTVSLFTTHLANDARRLGERERQIDRLLAIVDRQVGPGELPPILVGDLNFRPDERSTYERLDRRFWLANEAAPERPSGEPPPRVGVDHVWVGRSEHYRQTRGGFRVVRVVRTELQAHQISDHPLISVGFALRSAE